MNPSETPHPNNWASATPSNTTNPPQDFPPTAHHHHQQHPANNDDDDNDSPLKSPAAGGGGEDTGGRGVNDGRKRKFEEDMFDFLPPGYRFSPTDEELVVEYLIPQVAKKPKYPSRIHPVNIFNYHPQQLAEKFREFKENHWYFFTPRKKKYPKGTRPDRSAADGYWKATGSDKKVHSNGVQVGSKMSLVFHKRENKESVKTKWMMHEYTVATPPESKNSKRNQSDDMVLDDCVLCRIYKSKDKEEDDGGNDGGDDDDDIGDGMNNLPEGMVNHNNNYPISAIPESVMYPNPNVNMASIGHHQLHEPPTPSYFFQNSFNPNINYYHSNISSTSHPHLYKHPSPLHSMTHSFPSSFNPGSNHYSSNMAPISHQMAGHPTHLNPNSHNAFNPDANRYSNVAPNSHQLSELPGYLNTNGQNAINPDSNCYSNMAPSSHQLSELPGYLNRNSHNGFNPDSNCCSNMAPSSHELPEFPDSFSTGLMTGDLGNFDSTSSLYPLDVSTYANLENSASTTLPYPPHAHASSNQMMGLDDLSSGDYTSNFDLSDFSSDLAWPTSNYPQSHHHHQEDHHVVQSAEESQLSTNPDQPTHWDGPEDDQQSLPDQF